MSQRALMSTVLLLLAGCAAGGGTPGDETPTPQKIETAKLAVEAAKSHLAAAESDARLQEEANRMTLAAAQSEAKQAQMRADVFQADKKKRLDEAAFTVQQVKDQIEDAADELDQLKKMYQGNELADATKEIVLKRGERQLARSRTQLAMKEAENAKLRDHDLPTEQEKIALDLAQKTDDLKQASLKAENQLQKKRAELQDARVALRKAEEELEKLQKDASQAKPAPAAGR